MNKNKIIIFGVIIILICIGILYYLRINVQDSRIEITYESSTTEKKITHTTASYVSEMGEEAIVEYYSNDIAILNLLNTEYKDIQLDIAVSGSGARYENKDLGIVVWEKSPDVIIYKNDQPIFSGKMIEEISKEQIQKILPSTKWIWVKTLDGVGPLAQEGELITPKKTDAFTLTFSSDGKVNGTTDCNSFSGTYSISGISSIKFGSFMSTLMFCEESQEADFIKMIKDGVLYVSDDQIILENDKTTYFKKSE